MRSTNEDAGRCTAHLERLAGLGFPRTVAEEAGEAVQEGHFDFEVPTDLVEGTMERRRAALDGVEAGTSSDAGTSSEADMGATG